MNSKSLTCPKCRGILELDGSCSCGYGVKRRGAQPQRDTIDRTCPWNDHGAICGLIGSLSDATNGTGPWYCATHYWQLKGWPIKRSNKPIPSYREQWYTDHGLEYQPPKLGDVGTWKSVGMLTPQRAREPGDDDEPIAA